MLSPQAFAKQSGLSYQQVLIMCKKSELEDVIRTRGGYYKIPEKNLNKFLKDESYVSKEEYEQLIRENEKLKVLLNQVKNYILDLNI